MSYPDPSVIPESFTDTSTVDPDLHPLPPHKCRRLVRSNPLTRGPGSSLDTIITGNLIIVLLDGRRTTNDT